jgi:hypothetical protein
MEYARGLNLGNVYRFIPVCLSVSFVMKPLALLHYVRMPALFLSRRRLPNNA